MVAFRSIVSAVVVGLSVQVLAYDPVAKCGWVGCKYEKDLFIQDSGVADAIAPKPEDVAALIDKLTIKSQALQPVAASINIVNGPLVIAGAGPVPQLITGFVDIISTGAQGLASASSYPSVTDVQQSDLIFGSFESFVRVHQQLLSILIGKAGLFTTVPFVGAPITAVLRQIEALVDTLAFLLIDIAQERATDLQTLASSLGRTIDAAISAWSGS